MECFATDTSRSRELVVARKYFEQRSVRMADTALASNSLIANLPYRSFLVRLWDPRLDKSALPLDIRQNDTRIAQRIFNNKRDYPTHILKMRTERVSERFPNKVPRVFEDLLQWLYGMRDTQLQFEEGHLGGG